MRIDPKTWPALEVLKALGIVCMIVLHSWGSVITPEDLINSKDSLLLRLGHVLHFFCFFDIWIPAIAGAALNIQILNQKPPSRSLYYASKTSFYWGGILLASGWAFEIFLQNPYPLLAYNPLHFMGVSFLIISILLLLTKNRNLELWTLSFFILSFFKQQLMALFPFEYPETYEMLMLEGPLKTIKFYLFRMLFGIASQGWALIPWFSFVLVGFSFAGFYFHKRLSSAKIKMITLFSLLVTLVFLFFRSSLAFIKHQTLLDQYSALSMPISLFISCTSGFIFTLSLLSNWPNYVSKLSQSALNTFSQGSFWLFFIHLPLIKIMYPLFETYPLGIRLLGFPIFMLTWCFLVGLIIKELSKKKLKITLTKSTS